MTHHHANDPRTNSAKMSQSYPGWMEWLAILLMMGWLVGLAIAVVG